MKARSAYSSELLGFRFVRWGFGVDAQWACWKMSTKLQTSARDLSVRSDGPLWFSCRGSSSILRSGGGWEGGKQAGEGWNWKGRPWKPKMSQHLPDLSCGYFFKAFFVPSEWGITDACGTIRRHLLLQTKLSKAWKSVEKESGFVWDMQNTIEEL